MADDNFLSDAIGTVTSGGNVQSLESEAIQEGEQLFQQKTGIDVSSFLGGGSQAQNQGQSQNQDDSQSEDDDSADNDSSSDDDDSSN